MFFCRTTMLGLSRLSTNKAVMGGVPYTTAEAWQTYRKVAGMRLVAFDLGFSKYKDVSWQLLS